MRKKKWFTGVLAGVVISTSLVGCGKAVTKSQPTKVVNSIDYEELANPAHPNWSKAETQKQATDYMNQAQKKLAKYVKLNKNGKDKPKINTNREQALIEIEIAYIELGYLGQGNTKNLKLLHDSLIKPGKNADPQPDKTKFSKQFSKDAVDYAFTHISQQVKDLYAAGQAQYQAEQKAYQSSQTSQSSSNIMNSSSSSSVSASRK